MGVLSAVYYQRFEPLPILDGLIGATLEYGGAWQTRDDISRDRSVISSGAFIGADTPIGTLQLGFGVAEGGQRNYYTRIGRVF
jgi:NTE family protein